MGEHWRIQGFFFGGGGLQYRPPYCNTILLNIYCFSKKLGIAKKTNKNAYYAIVSQHSKLYNSECKNMSM